MTHAASPHSTPATLITRSSAALLTPTARPHSHTIMMEKATNTTAARAAACGKVPEKMIFSMAVVAVAAALSLVSSPAGIVDGVILEAVVAGGGFLGDDGQTLTTRLVPAPSNCTVRLICLSSMNFASLSSN